MADVQFKTVFVTVGTTKFTKLIDTVTSQEIILLFTKLRVQNIVVQIGADWMKYDFIARFPNLTVMKETDDSIIVNYVTDSGYKMDFLFVKYIEEFEKQIRRSDLIISHGGAGTCLDILRENKPFIIVINEDLMDNHQIELAEQLQTEEYCYYCVCTSLGNVLKNYEPRKAYTVPNKLTFSKYLNKCMGFVQ